MKNLIKLILLSLAGILFLGCGGDKADKKEVDLVYVNWAEGIAMAHVAKTLLEEQGYKVKMMNTDVAPLFASLSQGKADVFLEAWLPVTHKDYMDKYGDKLEQLGTIYDGARIGLVVPDYVDINSIDELMANRDKFDGKIIGIDAGAGIMQTTEQALEEYDLDFDLMTSSEAGMTATLKKAIDNNEWVVVTGWTPHWMFSRYNLKMLEDPKQVYGASEYIEAVARKGFSEEDPFVAGFIDNMHYTDDQIGDLMQTFEDGTNEMISAKTWIDDNRELVNSWIPETNSEN